MTSIPVSAPAARPRPAVARSKTKIVFFAVFLAATAFVTFMKNREAFNPTSEVAQHFAPAQPYLVFHAIFGILAMLLGVFQFSNRLRARYLSLHRTLGYIYVVSVFLAGPLAIPVAAKIGSPSLVAATCVQSFGWMVTTALALYCVRSGNITQHRRWMARGYPFAMVFTVTRLIIPIPVVLQHGAAGIEIVVWSTIAAAAILPSIVLEWSAIFPRTRAPAGAA